MSLPEFLYFISDELRKILLCWSTFFDFSLLQKLKSLQSDYENVSNSMKLKNENLTHLQEELQEKNVSCTEFENQVQELQNEISELKKVNLSNLGFICWYEKTQHFCRGMWVCS